MSSRLKAFLVGLPAAFLLLAVLYAFHVRISGDGKISAQAPDPQARADSAQSAAPAAPPVIDAKAAFRVGSDGMVEIPARFQLPGVSRGRSGASLKEWMAQYPPDQQQKLLDFNKRHFGVYMVNAPEQVAWMAQNGYPLPEDVIAAENLSADELRALVERGNEKAGFLLRERYIGTLREKVDANLAQGRSQADFLANDPEARRILKDDLRARQVVDASDSPYKGYVMAQEALLSSEKVGMDSAVISGLLLAQHLGDFRAGQFVTEYTADDPVRLAMLSVASAVSTHAAEEMALMRSKGCQYVGPMPGRFIPGDFAPVD